MQRTHKDISEYVPFCRWIPVVCQSVAMGLSAVQQKEGRFPRDEKMVLSAQNPSSGS